MALVALARMARRRRRQGAGRGSARPCRRWPTRSSWATATRRSGGLRSDALSETAVAALSIVAAGRGRRTLGRARAGGARRAREVLDVAPAGALDVDALLDASRRATCRRRGARRGARALRGAHPAGGAGGAADLGSRAHGGPRRAGERTGRAPALRRAGSDGARRPTRRARSPPRSSRASSRSRETRIRRSARRPSCWSRTRPDDAATEAVVAALEDSNEAVQRVALAAVGRAAGGGARRPGRRAGGRGRGEDPGHARELGDAHPRGARPRPARSSRRGAGGAPPSSPRPPRRTRTRSCGRRRSRRSPRSTPRARARSRSRMAAADPEPRVREAASALAR